MERDINIDTILGRLDLSMGALTNEIIKAENNNVEYNEIKRLTYELYKDFITFSYVLGISSMTYNLNHTDLNKAASLLIKYDLLPVNGNIREK